jgi:hypothetical protein
MYIDRYFKSKFCLIGHLTNYGQIAYFLNFLDIFTRNDLQESKNIKI